MSSFRTRRQELHYPRAFVPRHIERFLILPNPTRPKMAIDLVKSKGVAAEDSRSVQRRTRSEFVLFPSYEYYLYEPPTRQNGRNFDADNSSAVNNDELTAAMDVRT